MAEWYLRGLSGGNPLAFLAALGTLRSATLAWPNHSVAMGWAQRDAGWRPFLRIDSWESDQDELIRRLQDQLRQMDGHAVFTFAEDLTVTADIFRSLALKAQDQGRGDRRLGDFVAAFASDVLVDEKVRNSPLVQDTALRTMSGAGHQHFLKFILQLTQQTGAHHIRQALFSEWRYQQEGLSLRWDPADDRRYALRWEEPSGDPVRTVWGAYRLAVEGLPLMPVMPVGRRLETTGFSRQRDGTVFWTWPIWEGALNMDIVASLLALQELQSPNPPREPLRARGIVEVYRSERITQGKYRNFTPAVPV